MRPDLRSIVSLLALALSSGCAAQLGMGLGGAAPVRGHDARARWSGGFAGTIAPAPGSGGGALFGGELEGAAMPDDGSRWTLGLRAGYGLAPEPRSGDLGYELHLDLGTELDGTVLLEDPNAYLGATGSLLFFFGGTHEDAELNESVRIAKWVPLLVLSARPRAVRIPSCDADCWRFQGMLEVALRLHLLSDYL